MGTRRRSTLILATLFSIAWVACSQPAAGPQPERWGDFLLAQDEAAFGPKTLERAAPRPDFAWPHATGPFDHPNAQLVRDEATARADPHLPFLTRTPAGNEFFMAGVLADARGTAEVWLEYIRPELRTVQLPATGARPADSGDATITIVWSLRSAAPVYISPLRDPGNVAVAVFLDRTEKVMVKGNKGVMRVYSTRGRGDTYPARVPSVAVNWFEGDVFWSFQSHFLTPDEAVKAAESIRKVEIR